MKVEELEEVKNMKELMELLKQAKVKANIHIEFTGTPEDSQLAKDIIQYLARGGEELNPVVEAIRNTPVGETVEIENADGSTTEWIVLSKTESKAELIAADCIEERPYHHSTPYPTWSKSDIRAWLNGEYYNSLSEDMRKAIVEQGIATAADYKWEQKEKTKDKVYLLAEDGDRSERVVTPSGVVLMTEQLRCADEIKTYYWWLRSPRTGSAYPVWRAGVVFCSDGVIYQSGFNVTNTYGVRPAVTIAI